MNCEFQMQVNCCLIHFCYPSDYMSSHYIKNWAIYYELAQRKIIGFFDSKLVMDRDRFSRTRLR